MNKPSNEFNQRKHFAKSEKRFLSNFSFLSICLFALSFSVVGCKSEQYKAFESIKDTNDLNVLREFAATYNNNLEDKVRALYDTTYAFLLKDSSLYAAINESSSILDKFAAEQEYITSLPNGIHVDEVRISYDEHKAKAEELSAKLSLLQKAFSQYNFVETKFVGRDAGQAMYDSLDEYEFACPDQSGKGAITIKTEPISVQYYIDPWTYCYGIVNRECTGSYYVNDDAKIVVTIVEKRTYGKHPQAGDYSKDGMARLLQGLKKNYPVPKTRTLMLNFENDPTGFPSLSGIDSNRNDCWFETVLK